MLQGFLVDHGPSGCVQKNTPRLEGSKNLGTDHLSRLIAQTDVTVLDLYPAFTDAKATAASHYLPDGHPNAKGHALAASAIAAYLKANGLTPK